jgi:hypothetical protein
MFLLRGRQDACAQGSGLLGSENRMFLLLHGGGIGV